MIGTIRRALQIPPIPWPPRLAYHGGRSGSDHDQTRAHVFHGWRELLVEQLAPSPGQVVVDVGCGTGESFDALRRRVGPNGAIIGLDPSANNLERAAVRVRQRGWTNVRLIHAPVHAADLPAYTTDIPERPDGVLMCQVNAVLCARPALANVLSFARPGAAIAAGGGNWPPSWLAPLRGWVHAAYRPHVSDFTGFDQPWALLAELVPDLRISHAVFGWVAYGRKPAATPTPPTPGTRTVADQQPEPGRRGRQRPLGPVRSLPPLS